MGNIVNGTRVNGYMNDFDRSFLQGLGGRNGFTSIYKLGKNSLINKRAEAA